MRRQSIPTLAAPLNALNMPSTGRLVRHLVVLGAVALLARGLSLGYPDYHVDETFYLMTGDAMRHGALPYIDIWDRKPLGLFLFYEVLAAISPTVWSYQIAALAFVIATALLVTRLASRWSDEPGALLAGALYIAWLQPLTGGGGQSPVFYTLFVVGAFDLLVRSNLDHNGPINPKWALCAAFLCGIALWFKPTALFESGFVALGFAWLEWHRRKRIGAALILLAAIGLVIALPTLAGFAWYAAHGHFSEIWQATVLSNFNKTPAPALLQNHTIRYFVLVTMLLWACAFLGLNHAFVEKTNPHFGRLMVCWGGAGLVGFFAVPNFYSHYALPLVPILAIASAPYFSRKPLGRVIAIFAIGWALYVGQSFSVQNAGQASERFNRMIATVRSNMPNRTLYIYKGSSWIYHETDARQLTRFVFPEHLESFKEEGAIGVDPARELQRILAQNPDVIIIEDNLGPDYNRQTLPLVTSTVNRDYTIVCSLPGRNFEGEFHYFIFARSRTPDRSYCPAHSPGVLRLLSPKEIRFDFHWQ